MQFGFFPTCCSRRATAPDAVAAYFIGVRILALSFLPGFGFAAPRRRRWSDRTSAPGCQRAQTAGWHATWMSVALMSTTGVSGSRCSVENIFVDTPAVVANTVSFIHMLVIRSR